VPVATFIPADNIRTCSKNFGFENDDEDPQYYNFEWVRYGRTDPIAEGQDAISPRVISIGGEQITTGYFVHDLCIPTFTIK